MIRFLLYTFAFTSAVTAIEDKFYWYDRGAVALENKLRQVQSQDFSNFARNVIIFVGDGMGPSTLTAARIYQGGETSDLIFESFPYVGLLKTYAVDKKVPDSACAATALFGGVKTNYDVSGLDATVKLGDCTTSWSQEAAHVPSILQMAQYAGKSTGFVTNTRVTHATPSALYAHVPDRRWECEAKIPLQSKRCRDIARQLVEQEPGVNFNVIMGGGRQCLVSNSTESANDPIDTWACRRMDGIDLISRWKQEKEARISSQKYAVVNNTESLMNINPHEIDYVLGIFANGHLKMDFERDNSSHGMPSLEQMTSKAIDVLQKNEKGYVLVVEGGLIDMAHHRGHARQALDETLALERAVRAAMLKIDQKETLIVVTSDHDQGLSFTGVASRESSILGLAEKSKFDEIPYTSLTYSTGDQNNYQYEVKNNTVSRKNPIHDNTESFSYFQQSGIITDEVQHSGTDVHVYAIGPKSHLFTGVHEQNFVAFAVVYAAHLNVSANTSRGSSVNTLDYNLFLLCPLLILTIYIYGFVHYFNYF